jgi:hypothetical protein
METHKKAFRRYKTNNDMAFYCQKLMKSTINPDSSQISDLVKAMIKNKEPISLLNPFNKIASLIKEWFRKRREYLTSKINQACQNHLNFINNQELFQNLSKECQIDFLSHLFERNDFINDVACKTKVPFLDESAKIQFISKKINIFYLKLRMKQ